jgi:hypothetical protein
LLAERDVARVRIGMLAGATTDRTQETQDSSRFLLVVGWRT